MGLATKARRVVFMIGAALLFPPAGFSDDVAAGIMVFACDTSMEITIPPSTTACLNGADTLAFGTNGLVTFAGYLEEGTHSIEVTTAATGYLLRQSPSDPNAINDPYSDYGNPRYVEISTATNFTAIGYQFDPFVTASAVVRDAWTMERLENTAIEFIFEGTTGAEITKAKYPSTAVYASNWVSNVAGDFPTNTIMYLHDYAIRLTRPGYESFRENDVITNASPGDAFDLGTFFLQPVDTNNNLIGDEWETLYFGSGSNVEADADADHDGMSNRDEYVAGTNPTNQQSYLWLMPISSSNRLELAWYTKPDRTYRISGTPHLCSDEWVQVGGPWEATNGQTEMVWTEANLNLSWNSNYRVEVVPCWHSNTNQILVNTNRPYHSGGGTNTWDGGLPPLPQ